MTEVARHELRFEDRVLEILDRHLSPRVAEILDRLVKPAAVYTLLAVVGAISIGLFWVWNDNRALYQRVHNAERDVRVLKETVGLTGELERHGELLEQIAAAVAAAGAEEE